MTSGSRCTTRMENEPRRPGRMDSLKRITQLQQSGDLREALRLADRQWRTTPHQRAQLAPILGQLLLQAGESPATAFAVFTRAAELAPSSEREADLVKCLLAANRPDLAQQRLLAALQNYACESDDALANAARLVLTHPETPMSGWMALTPKLEAYAEFLDDAETARFEMYAADGSILLQQAAQKSGGGLAVKLRIPQVDQSQFIRLTANGQPLLGGDRVLPLDFRLKAFSSAHDRLIEGSAKLEWSSDAVLDVELRDENGQRKYVRTRNGEFSVDADKAKLGDQIKISVKLPDGRVSELADSPLLFKPAISKNLRVISPRKSALTPTATRTKKPPVDIIIPVYLGVEETLACIDSVRRTVGSTASILVIDDASPDPALSAELDALAEAGHITLLRNTVNLGFAATVNRAMTIHPTHDAVLVNADVVVFGEWLSHLRSAAYRANNIATVTPFSDDDSVTSYTDQSRDSANVQLAAELNDYAARAHRGKSIELPVGVGFCMYIRRAAWQEVGEFDATTFGKGYGEESDWCMRARKRGWQHRLAADAFVHHAGGSSFKTRRMALLARAQRLLNLRHVGYDSGVERFLKADPLHALRRSFDAQRLRSEARPMVLLVTLGLGGGVERYVTERCEQLKAQGKFPLILRPHKTSPDACALWNTETGLQHLHFRIPDELPRLRTLLASLPLQSIEFNHFLGLDPRLVKSVLSLGVSYDVFLHDYSFICPRITLMNETGRYCGEPDLAACNRCVKRNGTELTEDITVGALRRRSETWLSGARRVSAPSQDTAQRYLRYFPQLKIDVVSLEPNVVVPGTISIRRRQGPIRVALIGTIAEHKGYRVLLNCAQDAKKRGLDLEFLLIGHTDNDAPLINTGKVFITGRYGDVEVPGLLAREQPDLIWLPSVWPETWCYTLSHAIRSGLPVVTFDIGAMAERLRKIGIGELLPLDLNPRQFNERLLAVASNREAQ